MATVRVGVVGYGYAGRAFHTYLVGLAEGLELAAVSTRDPERRARAAADWNVKTFEQPAELFNDPGIDLVVLATPHDTHKDLTLEALAAGKHVVVDKVMAITADDCAEMTAAATRAGKLLSVFHNRRWDGDFLTLQRVIQSGLLGKVDRVEAGIYGYGSPRGWRGSRDANGGILYDWGAHLVDQALLLADSPVEWVSSLSQFNNPDTDIESWSRCVIGFKSGLIYTVEVSNRSRLSKPRWYISGASGSLVKEGLDPQESAMNRREIRSARWSSEHDARVKTVKDGLELDMKIGTMNGDWTQFYQNIADALLKDAELAVKPESVVKAVAVLEASRWSADTGERVRFGEDGRARR